MERLEMRRRPNGLEFGPAQDPVPNVVAALRQAASALDAMWREALASSAAETAFRLGEASQGVHRALIALSGPGRVYPVSRNPVLTAEPEPAVFLG